MPAEPILRAGSMPDPAAMFTPAQCASLVDAIAVHDEIDLAATLPAEITLAYDADLLERCYLISYRLWRDVDRATLVRLANRLTLFGRLGDADALTFKSIRARAKQLRFVHATLGAGHGYPPLLDRLTRFMGQAQDAARGGRRRKAAIRGALLRLLLTGPLLRALDRETGGIAMAGPDEFRDYVLAEMEGVRHVLARRTITNRTFHDTRKIVSRLVAFYDTLTVLAPSDYHHAVVRYLSTINGMMGALHDDMAARKAITRRDYDRLAEPLPAPIAERLATLAATFAASQGRSSA